MSPSTSPDRRRILVDLKPALDGYAGIPQETRLLFRGLRQLPAWGVNGLIQHGARRLRPGLCPADASLPIAQQIYKLSKLIVSIDEGGGGPKWREIADERVRNFWSTNALRLMALANWPARPTRFAAQYFPDFVWRALFDKTLPATDKQDLTGDEYHVIGHSRRSFQNIGMSGDTGRTPRFPTVDTRGFEYFLAQTPFPARVSPGTQLVVRYHDAVPIFLPHTIKDKAFHQATHFQALRSNIASGAKFVCISEATRFDLLTVFPELEARASVIHNMISEEYYEDDSQRGLVPKVARNRLAEIKQIAVKPPESATNAVFDYLLMVSTLEPRKNHHVMLSAWEQLRYSTHPDLKLVVVGSVGWDALQILRSFKPWIERGDLLYLNNVPSTELRALYKHAAGTVCPSVAEGFDYSGVEAMRCGCPVAASDIPVHREIYEDAAVYFDPYSADAAARALRSILPPADSALRAGLVDRGRTVSKRYLSSNILPRWVEFFEAARSQPRGKSTS